MPLQMVDIPQMTLEIERYDAPLGAERQYIVKLEDLEHYVKSLSESGGFKEQYGVSKKTIDIIQLITVDW